MKQSTTENVMNSQKLSELRQKLGQKAKNEPKFRFYTLYGHLQRKDVLYAAWEMVRKNSGSSGVDEISIDDIENYNGGVEKFLEGIRLELQAETYRPSPVRRVYIPKANGKLRPLGIPTIKDRVVQAALRLIIEPIFEADFLDCSYGFRPERSAHQAIEEVRKAINAGRYEVYDADLKGYFDSIPHDKLMRAVGMRIVDRKVLKLIRMWLETPVQEKGRLIKTDKGTPQGGVISPLLANLFLHWFDKTFLGTAHKVKATLVRYADDLVILAKQIKQDLVAHIEGYIINRMGLEINREKTRVVDLSQPKEEIKFLGYTFRYLYSEKRMKRYCYMTCSKDSQKRARKRVKELLSPKQNHISVEEAVCGLNKFLVGWGSYFCKGYPSKAFRRMNEYVSGRMIANLKKRSQRGHRTIMGRSWKAIIKELGIMQLAKGEL